MKVRGVEKRWGLYSLTARLLFVLQVLFSILDRLSKQK